MGNQIDLDQRYVETPISPQPPVPTKDVDGTSYSYSIGLDKKLRNLATRVTTLRSGSTPNADTIFRIGKYFKIKNIYNSNAIEGNSLDIGETRLVVERGLTITGRSLKDQAEAKNLSAAIDFMEKLAKDASTPMTAVDIRQIHALILKNVDDDNAGKYRSVEVAISGSQFKTPNPENVPSQMDEFARWFSSVSCAKERFACVDGIVNAVAAHAWFVYIHPFIDGNGRVARLLMNLILMRYGFPIAIVGKEDRKRYYDALEVSQSGDLTDFLGLIAECDTESVEEYEAAVKGQREQEEWTRQFAEKITQSQQTRNRNEYEIWKSAMELLRGYFERTVININSLAAAKGVRLYFKPFDLLEFEKYQSLRNGVPAKRTWFFRIDMRSERESARYLFFFGGPSYKLKSESEVTLHIAREEEPYYYERLEAISSPNVPSICEIGYSASSEQFVAHYKGGSITKGKIETLGRVFVDDVGRLHFP